MYAFLLGIFPKYSEKLFFITPPGCYLALGHSSNWFEEMRWTAINELMMFLPNENVSSIIHETWNVLQIKIDSKWFLLWINDYHDPYYK